MAPRAGLASLTTEDGGVELSTTVVDDSSREMGGRVGVEAAEVFSREKLGGREAGKGGLEGLFGPERFAPASPVPALNRAADDIDGRLALLRGSEEDEPPTRAGIVPNSSYSRFWWSV